MHDDMMTRGDIKRLLNRVMVHREAVRRDLENLCRLTRVLFSVIEEGGTAHPNIITRGR